MSRTILVLLLCLQFAPTWGQDTTYYENKYSFEPNFYSSIRSQVGDSIQLDSFPNIFTKNMVGDPFVSYIWHSQTKQGRVVLFLHSPTHSRTVCKLVNVKKEGTYLYRTEEGDTVECRNYHQDTLNGYFVTYEFHDYKWEFAQRGLFVKGLKEGVWIYNGELVIYNNGICNCFGAVVTYGNGIENGLFISYESKYEQGMIKEEGYYKNGLKDGVWRKWDWDLNISFDGSEPWKGKHEDLLKTDSSELMGHLVNESHYMNDTLHGAYLEYWANGRLYESGCYDHGIKEGIWIEMFDNGKMKSKDIYVHGLREGYGKTWYDNGKGESKEHYQNGQLDGKSKRWCPNGFIYEKGNYKNGQPVSKWKTYDCWKFFRRVSLVVLYNDDGSEEILLDRE